jgi:hypothetical protein
MSVGGYGPFEPLESSEPGQERVRPLKWWQAALTLSPFLALIIWDLVWGAW